MPDEGLDFFRYNAFAAQLRDQLAEVSGEHQIAFALHCAERLLPLYEPLRQQRGGGPDLANALGLAWSHIAGNRIAGVDFDALAACVEAVTLPEEEDDLTQEEHDAIAILDLLDLTFRVCKNPSPAGAARAGACVTNEAWQGIAADIAVQRADRAIEDQRVGGGAPDDKKDSRGAS
jgi:hypothetical protein